MTSPASPSSSRCRRILVAQLPHGAEREACRRFAWVMRSIIGGKRCSPSASSEPMPPHARPGDEEQGSPARVRRLLHLGREAWGSDQKESR